MKFGSADRPLDTDRQPLWSRPRALKLTSARLVTYLDTGNIKFECRDFDVTAANDRRLPEGVIHRQEPQFSRRRPTGATSGTQPTHRAVATSDGLWISGDETQRRGLLLVMNMGEFAYLGQSRCMNWSIKYYLCAGTGNQLLTDFPGDHSQKSS